MFIVFDNQSGTEIIVPVIFICIIHINQIVNNDVESRNHKHRYKPRTF